MRFAQGSVGFRHHEQGKAHHDGIEVTIEFPWDLSSTPHFLPEATLERRQTVIAPLLLQWQIMLAGGLGGVLVGLLAAVAALSIRRPQPWSLLRSE